MYLVDTNVISALAPSKVERNDVLVAWFNRASSVLYLSVITGAEVMSGISKADREGATTKAQRLRDWWGAIEHLYSDRILPFDLACAHRAGRFLDESRAHRPGFEDIAIAATAQVHGLTVLSRNLRHFLPLGVAVQNPFEAIPTLP